MGDGDAHRSLPEDGVEERCLFLKALLKQMQIGLAEQSLQLMEKVLRTKGLLQPSPPSGACRGDDPAKYQYRFLCLQGFQEGAEFVGHH